MRVKLLFLYTICFGLSYGQVTDQAMTAKLSNIKATVPLEYNDDVRSAILDYSRTSSFVNNEMLRKFITYDGALEAIFLENNTPIELRYACMSLSNCNLIETNTDGNEGFFAMKYRVAQSRGLVITNYIDERRDVLKSAIAFCKEINELYANTGDWRVALTQYQATTEEWMRAKVMSRDLDSDFWFITKYLPQESRLVYPKFVAAAYLANNYNELGYKVNALEIETSKVAVLKYTTLYQLASKLGVDYKLLRELNPEYKKNVIPQTDQAFMLVIPSTRVKAFYLLGDEVYTYAKTPVYTSTEVKVIEKTVRDTIKIKEIASIDLEPNVSSSAIKDTEIIYAVRNGDMLLTIADLFDCDVVQLQRWNKLDGEKIDINQKLKIKVPSAQLEYYKKIDQMTKAQRQAILKKD